MPGVMPSESSVAELGLAAALMLTSAKLGGELATRLRQPAVLGELLVGILLGCLPVPFLTSIRSNGYVDMLAQLGVIVLLFEVGIESTVRDVLQVGFAAARVALLGTAATFVAGLGAARLTVPHAGTLVHLFLAGALTATSIGISARVLKDAGASRSKEGHTILGASVIDDVLGLVVLAIFTGAVANNASGGAVTFSSVVWLVAKTLLFLVGAVVLGRRFAEPLFRLTSRLRASGALVATGLSFCFVLAWLSSAVGLAPIIGAFTAGLILEPSHSELFVARGEGSLSERIEPISQWLVPMFFVLIGMRSDFRALTQTGAPLLVVALVVAAVVGKLACALGTGGGCDRLAVAFGMMPRGEVSLVFASFGLSTNLLDPAVYSALVSTVVVTTLITPTALRWRLASRRPATTGQPTAHDCA
jgi:Kef-type K+ transport system membrane component KefB